MAFSYSFPSHTVPHIHNHAITWYPLHATTNTDLGIFPSALLARWKIHQFIKSHSCTKSLEWLSVIVFLFSWAAEEVSLQAGVSKAKWDKLRRRFQLPWLNLGRITSWIKRAKKSRLMTHSRELSWAQGDEWSKSNTKEEGKMLFQWKLYFTQTGHIALIALFTLCGIARHVHDSINFSLFRTRQTLLALRYHRCWQLLTSFFHITATLFTFPIEADMKQLWFKEQRGDSRGDQESCGLLTRGTSFSLNTVS